MKISVVIPCHNAAPYVAQTIGSVVEQTRAAHEILILLDRCTDESLAVVRGFGDRVKVREVEFGSAPKTRNFGASLCTGDAIMFLDADDVLAPQALSGLAEALERTPNAAALIPWNRLELVSDRWVERPASTPARKTGHDLLSNWLTGHYYPPCCVLWSAAAFAETGGWSEECLSNQDGDLAMRSMILGVPFVMATQGHAYYRRVPQQASLSGQRFTREALLSRLRVIEKLSVWLAERSRLREYRSSLRVAFDQIHGDCEREGFDDLKDSSGKLRQLYCGEDRTGKAMHAIRTTAQRARALVKRSTKSADAHSTTSETARRYREENSVHYGLSAAGTAARGEFALALCTRDVGTLSHDTAATEEVEHQSPPIVSVVIPTYNRAQLVCRAIESVLAQTFCDFEVLVIDDASTDDTEAQVQSLGDTRVRYLRQPQNRDVSAARNRGMREARGQFIAFLDSDDEWLPEKLERQLAVMHHAPAEVGLVYGGALTLYQDGAVTEWQPVHRGDVLQLMLLRNITHVGSTSNLIRRDAIRVAGFFDEDIPAMEDYDYWIRLARFYHFDFVDQPVVRYHDVPRDDRRSLVRDRDMRARRWLFRKHKRELRRSRVAHRFLLASASRRLSHFEQVDGLGAVVLAARALAIAPTDPRLYRDVFRIFFSNSFLDTQLTKLLRLAPRYQRNS